MILLKKLYQVNTIDTSEFVLKTFNIRLIKKIDNANKKILDASEIVKTNRLLY